MTFDQIAAHGQDRWLEELRQELRAGDYRPQPLLRVWIPKSNGGQRPLGIPCIRDRVVEMAALLVLGPIFEADLLRNQYGFRPERDAKMAVRQAFWHVNDHSRTEVVDADLSDYFSSIPHGPLMRCVSRRVADGTLLSVIKRWLTAPVIEHDKCATRCTTEAKDRHRGTPQGSGESLLPSLPAGLGAVRSPKTARRPRRQLCRRSCHLLPPWKPIGSTGDDAVPDDAARVDGERNQDAIGATA